MKQANRSTHCWLAIRAKVWRLGATGCTDRLDFQISLDATSLTTGVWTNVDALDFLSPATTPTGQKDCDLAANRTRALLVDYRALDQRRLHILAAMDEHGRNQLGRRPGGR